MVDSIAKRVPTFFYVTKLIITDTKFRRSQVHDCIFFFAVSESREMCVIT